MGPARPGYAETCRQTGIPSQEASPLPASSTIPPSSARGARCQILILLSTPGQPLEFLDAENDHDWTAVFLHSHRLCARVVKELPEAVFRFLRRHRSHTAIFIGK